MLVMRMSMGTPEEAEERNKCNRLCWNTLFLFGDFDENLAVSGTNQAEKARNSSNYASFLIAQGNLWHEKPYKYTIMAPFSKNMNEKNIHPTPEGVMCSFLMSIYLLIEF